MRDEELKDSLEVIVTADREIIEALPSGIVKEEVQKIREKWERMDTSGGVQT